MRKHRTRTSRAIATAIMLLAVFFLLPVATPAMPAKTVCHEMTMAAHRADMTGNHAVMGRFHHCCDHQPGQPCPDDMNCSGACMSQCAASLAFLQTGAAALLPLPRNALAPPPNETAASFQDRLNAPPPRG